MQKNVILALINAEMDKEQQIKQWGQGLRFSMLTTVFISASMVKMRL